MSALLTAVDCASAALMAVAASLDEGSGTYNDVVFLMQLAALFGETNQNVLRSGLHVNMKFTLRDVFVSIFLACGLTFYAVSRKVPFPTFSGRRHGCRLFM